MIGTAPINFIALPMFGLDDCKDLFVFIQKTKRTERPKAPRYSFNTAQRRFHVSPCKFYPCIFAIIGRNTKHAAVMAEHGVNYDNPQHPQTLAKLREERVRKEKGTKATTAVTQQQQQQVQHQVQQPAQAQQHQQAQQQPQQQQQQPQQQQSQQSQQSHVQQQAGATAMVSAPAVATAQFTTSGVVARAMPNAGATIPQSQNSATTTTGTSIVTSATSVAHTTVPSVMAVVGGVGGVTSAHQVTPATEAQKIVTNAQPQPIVAVRVSFAFFSIF